MISDVLRVSDAWGASDRLVPVESIPEASAESTRVFEMERNDEEQTINGFPTATATAKGDQWAFRLYAVRFGSDVYRFIFASKRITPEIDRGFREAIGTFRRMTIAESKAAPGHEVELSLDTTQLHLFDREGGRSLTAAKS